MDILDDMGVSKLSAKVFLKVNYSFKWIWAWLDLYRGWIRNLVSKIFHLLQEDCLWLMCCKWLWLNAKWRVTIVQWS